ncbi:AMIN-like domain-containing (lipo)protein [Actinacidiphila sp. bgisy160]|uniref:AMIN-like domain-containing (lipo)protein n=1 Tax=Actinacidiphila sp. bgisy160 TaxID=3413796 RepID=UPI003D70A249
MRAKRYGAVLAALVMTGAGMAVAAPTVAAAPAAACPTGWGSLPKSATDADFGPLTDIRTGRHECYDRVVFDVPTAGTDTIGYTVRYVAAVHQDGSGRVIPVSGGAIIEIRVAAPSYDPQTGAATYPGRAGRTLPGVDLTGYRTFRDARFASSFEGDTQVGLGVRARLPFRVFQLSDRLVVDVAHTW